jgi:hypothetical protein
MRRLIPFFFAMMPIEAQIVSVGVKLGAPVTPAVSNYGGSPTNILDTGRWTIGPTIEFRLLYGFSVEVDALYRGYRTQDSFASSQLVAGDVTYPATFNSYHSDVKVWDFPTLLKYRMGSRKYHPFVVAGYTSSHRTFDTTSSVFCVSSQAVCAATPTSPYYQSLGHFSFSSGWGGPTAGAGVEFNVGKIKISPEVRYTHYSNPTANQVTVMAGFTF